MSNVNVIRAWKDPEYRLSLSESERAQLPAHPVGLIELEDADLDAASGGAAPSTASYCNTTCCNCSHHCK